MVDKAEVYRWIDNNEGEVVDFLSGLIKIPSVNPWFYDYDFEPKERELQEFVAKFIEPIGFETDIWEPDWKELKKYENKPGYYEGRDFTNRPNLCGVLKGAGGGRSLLLCGHIDVVKASDDWTEEPFGGVVKDGKMYGRGTVDMKGGVAAMIIAIKAIVECGIKLKGDVLIGTLADEEAGGMGTLGFVHKGYRADGAIMTEATNMSIAPLCRGILWGKIIIPGKAGHIEIKQGDWRDGGAVDAIQLTKLYLQMIDAKNKEWAARKVHPLLPIPCQILVAQINAGEYPTTYAPSSTIVFNAQYLPSEKDENFLGGTVKKEIEEFVKNVAMTNDWLKENPPKIEWLVDADCAETPEASDFVNILKQSVTEAGIPLNVEGICAHTDMGWFSNVGIPIVNFGPGDAKLAHQADEYIKIDELIEAAKAIAAMILNWCGTEV